MNELDIEFDEADLTDYAYYALDMLPFTTTVAMAKSAASYQNTNTARVVAQTSYLNDEYEFDEPFDDDTEPGGENSDEENRLASFQSSVTPTKSTSNFYKKFLDQPESFSGLAISKTLAGAATISNKSQYFHQNDRNVSFRSPAIDPDQNSLKSVDEIRKC